jgi:hypothetical protein
VTSLAILALIGACFFVLFGLAALLGGVVAALASVPFFAMLAGVGAIGVVVFCLIAAAISAWIGMGLLKLRNIARILLLVFVGLSLLGSAIGLVSALLHVDAPSAIVRLVIGGIDLWILAYLLKPHVKQAFGATGF